MLTQTPRLALMYDETHRPDGLVAVLAAAGLAPNVGVLPVSRICELAWTSPEVVVLAADLARPDGLPAVRSLHRQGPDACIVVIAPDSKGMLARQALNAGAAAFVRDQDPATLGPAVRAVVAGFVCVPRAARRSLAK